MGNGGKQDLHCPDEALRRMMRSIPFLSVCVALLSAGACTSRTVTPPKPPEATRSLNCVPRSLSPDKKLSLAIVSIAVSDNKTRVKLVAYAPSEAVDFYLPVYLMSRGRWSIREDGERPYLLDERCRNYKLNDRKSTENMKAPVEGKVSLKPQSSFEIILEFPPLPADVSSGVLVYDTYTVPFTLLESDASSS